MQQLVHDTRAAHAQHAHLLEVIELDTGKSVQSYEGARGSSYVAVSE
jgi:hypothetical protein